MRFRLHRLFLNTVLGLAAAILVVTIAAIFVLQSGWFRNKVRERIITEVENATGGRVEAGNFDYNWERSTAGIGPFTLHGTEPAGSPPLFHADKIQVGLKIVSFLERKADIASLTIDRPVVRLLVNPDGTLNLPTPKAAAQTRNLMAGILNLKIQRIVLLNGFAEYNSRRFPLNVRGENVAASLRYLGSPERYEGELRIHPVRLTAADVRDAIFDVSAKFAVEKNRFRIESASLKRNRSAVELAGAVVDLASPRANFEVKSRIFPADIANFIHLPLEARGEVAFNGKAAISFEPLQYRFDGRLNGRDLTYSNAGIQLRNFSFASKISAKPGMVDLSSVDLRALQGGFRGALAIESGSRFKLDGTAEGFSLQQLAELEGQPAGELSGSLAGPVHAEGAIENGRPKDVTAQATLHIARGATGVPVEGSVELNYNQRAGALALGNSNLTLGTTQVAASGNLGQALAVHIVSHNLRDLLLALPLVGQKAPKELPVALIHGSAARFDGTVAGPLANPRIAGQLQLGAFEADKRDFNDLSASFEATKSGVAVKKLALDSGSLHATGSGQLGLVNWAPRDRSPVRGSLEIRGADVQQLLQEAGRKIPVSGIASANVTIAGTYGDLAGSARVQVAHVTAYEQPFDRVTADATFRDDTVEVQNGQATSGKASAGFSAIWNNRQGNNGQLRFDISGSGFNLAQIKAVAKIRQGITGSVEGHATGAAHLVKDELHLDDLNGRVSIQNASADGKAIGNMTATANTRGGLLDIRADADVRGSRVHGQGEWTLADDYPGRATIDIPHVALATVMALLPIGNGQELPFGGFLSATVNVSGPLKKSDELRADVTVPEFQMNASSSLEPRAGAQAKDLILRNASPLQFEVTSKGLEIRSARFAGADTTLEAAGRVGFGDNAPWNLRVTGAANLAILQLFNHDLLASGIATVNATVRGPFKQPELGGRLQLRNASLYLADLPNGVEKAHGTIVFDGSRATVERLSGESGGGAIVFEAGSFVGFSGQTLIYHAQAQAEHVRYRSPDGISITANANLSLSGTSERSTLAGTVTVTRAAFSPHTDVGSLLASTARPVSVPVTPNAYLTGMQLDIRIDSGPNLEVITSLTRDIQAGADLRLRGNVDRPILLGDISVTQGEIDFFGNRYTINRGDLTFSNPAKIEPVVNMDLGTRVRGITVDIAFTGPLEKLNFSYRSDPPLESNQIIALLAVGRQPVGLGALANSPATANTSFLAMGSNDVLKQAITAPVSGRLQRFFGVSHIKIDPQLTDITSVPQARLSFEQQISRDITLTYITNLSRTSEQIVRVEWDLSRQWSVVAVRDENGFFGVDFQYRRAFR